MLSDDQIIEMAKQANIKIDPRFGECYTGNVQLIAFARLIEREVREEAAKVCETVCDRARPSPSSHAYQTGAIQCAAAIRESGK